MAGTLSRLRRRAEFLAVSSTGRKWVTPGMIVQVRPVTALPDISTSAVRYGLTASKKVGGAVQRNRARRRLRALAEAIIPTLSLPVMDIVLIARPATINLPFEQLGKDLRWALNKLAEGADLK